MSYNDANEEQSNSCLWDWSGVAGFSFESCSYQMAPLNFNEQRPRLRFPPKAVLRHTLRNPQCRESAMGISPSKPFICYFSFIFSILPDLQDIFPPSNDCKILRKNALCPSWAATRQLFLKVESDLRTAASYPKEQVPHNSFFPGLAVHEQGVGWQAGRGSRQRPSPQDLGIPHEQISKWPPNHLISVLLLFLMLLFVNGKFVSTNRQ